MRRVLWVAVAGLSLIMIVVATRRIVHLSDAGEGFDSGFALHPRLTLAHILPGLIFIVFGPLQFISGLRKRLPGLHRLLGRILLVDALLVGVTALVMSWQMSIGGRLESAATFVFGVFFLLAFGRAFVAIRARRVAEHRRWAIRAYAVGLGVGMVRPIVGVFFATSRLTHLTPDQFFGVAFWLGFSISLMATEVWIRSRYGIMPGAAPNS
jgi:uncharacterized membrane protein